MVDNPKTQNGCLKGAMLMDLDDLIGMYAKRGLDYIEIIGIIQHKMASISYNVNRNAELVASHGSEQQIPN